ncbi:MAG TPA: KH domain-containing protein [Candidatus Saccharimonadales bacterium]|nr:KH domain-containing protein [Candidatus Saccharimonadales bacterium]
MGSIDQQFVEFIVKSLVSKPEAVQIERRIDEKGVLLELTVDPEDLGRVIGKRGATAQSLRTLLRALGTKNDARYNLKIVDNGDGAVATSTSNDDNTGAPASDDDTTDAADAPALNKNENDVVSKTRKELEELDDLDV